MIFSSKRLGFLVLFSFLSLGLSAMGKEAQPEGAKQAPNVIVEAVKGGVCVCSGAYVFQQGCQEFFRDGGHPECGCMGMLVGGGCCLCGSNKLCRLWKYLGKAVYQRFLGDFIQVSKETLNDMLDCCGNEHK